MTFYAVQVLMNGRAGTLPSRFNSKIEAINFVNDVKTWEADNIKVETHLYEVTEIEY